MMSETLPKLALDSAYRYAIYFAPATDDRWWRAGSEWLGRDAFTGTYCRQPLLIGLRADEQQRLTAAPRRYGWHATLKAPFALAETVNLRQLRLALHELCGTFSAFTLPPLNVSLLDDFLALVLNEKSFELDRIAHACVSQLHPFAAPLSEGDLARRRVANLSAAEDAQLLAWGYPYVMDLFRFHISLTGSISDIPDSAMEILRNAAHDWFAELPHCRFESIALFAEPTPGSDFVLLEQIQLGA